VGSSTVGFNVGDSKHGVTFVDSPAGTKVNSDESLKAALICEELVKTSGLEPYDKCMQKGFWRIFLYRESKVTNQALVSIVVSEAESDQMT